MDGMVARCRPTASDLSYNRLSGTLDGNFSLLGNLIDLYLASNQLEWVAADAFRGLARLQVLHLNSNNLKQIHTSAFVPLRATLYELNLAHNTQLSQLTHLEGLERLASFKAQGNKQLSQLPYLPRARLLAFTYAYHCCDYLGAGRSRRKNVAHNRTSGSVSAAGNERDGEDEKAPLARQLFQLVASKLARFLWPVAEEPRASDEQNYDSPPVTSDDGHWPTPSPFTRPLAISSADDDANLQNLNETLLWPARESSAPSDALESAGELVRRMVIGAQGSAESEVRRARAARWARANRMGAAPTAGAQHFSRKTPAAHLIDELILQVKQIRFAHSVGKSSRLAGASTPSRDYALTAADANEHDRHEPHHFLSAAPMDELSGKLVASGQLADRVARVLARDFRPAGLEGPRGRRASETPAETHIAMGRPDAGRLECLPQPNAFQPCRDLFDAIWLRASIWLVFLFAFVGNILVIVVLGSVRPSSSTSALTSIMWFNAAHSKRHIDVPRFLVLNLAVADLLMALYLGLLAFVDLSTLGEFRAYAIKWQHSSGCQLAGFLAVLSSELSVFILAIITLERNYAITNAVHLNRRLSLQKAMLIMLLGYLYAFTMAILPLNGVNDYRKFSICLPLDFEPQLELWQSPANLYLVTLVGINSLSFLLLLGCYLRMYCAIRGSQAWNTNDLKIAKRMSILVLTDFFCWVPLIIVGSLALFRNYLVGLEGLKVLIIFVLPLNSLANPFLYAITTKKFKRDLKVVKKRLRLEQFCELLSLMIGLLTSCRRPRRKTNYAHATVAIRRNQHKCAKMSKLERKLARRLESTKARQQLEVIVGEPQHRQAGLTNHAKSAVDSLANNAMASRQRPVVDVDRENWAKHSIGARRGSQLLAKTIRLMRGAQLEEQADGSSDLQSGGQNACNTFNPVTMNKTTCFSCHKRLMVAAESLESRACFGEAPHHEEAHFEASSNRPQIVLDSFELDPTEDIARPTRTPSDFVTQQHLSARQARSQLHSQTSCQSDYNNRLHDSPDSIACAPIGQQARLRPGSPNSRASVEHEFSPGAAHASCQTIMMKGRESRARIRSPADGDLEAEGRSASACAFNWPKASARSNQLGDKLSHQLSPNIVPSAQVYSCSCDTIRFEAHTKATLERQEKRSVTASSSSQSRSINRLMFGPFVKAWSTLQLSLQARSTALTPTILEQASRPQREPARGPINCETIQSTANNRRSSSNSSSGSSDSESTEQNIIDDILQMSSPLRKRLLNERRMSRSCDLIISYAPSQDANSTSAATLEPNSSSYDHNDDQRILLATINQLTTRRKKRQHVARGQIKERDPSRQNSTRKRPTCTRCRSWSPALLDKLEDCMHQIKKRIPKLGSIEKGTKGEGAHAYKAIEQKSSGHSSTASIGLSFSRGPDGPQECSSAAQIDMLSDSSSEKVHLGRDSTDDLEVDDFNEIGFVEWTRNMQKKVPINCYNNRRKIRRLHQQLSGNSDTLSSHTVGTTLTNLSFDSSSNIPAAIIGPEQQSATNKRTNSID